MIAASQLVAHRGYQAKYPENTRLSLTKAIDAGAMFVELDVQFSSDHLPIIYHDADLLRVSGRSGTVLTQTRAELMSYPAYEPNRLGDAFISETIAPLEALVAILQANPEVTAFVELKEESIDHCGRQLMVSSVQHLLSPVAEQTVMISFDYPLVIAAREAGWPRVGVVLRHWADVHGPEVAMARPDYIYTDYLTIPQDCDLMTVPALKQSVLVAYEVGTVALGNALLARKVNMLETFEIETLLKG